MTWDTKYIGQHRSCFLFLFYYFIEYINNTIADIHGQPLQRNPHVR